MDKISNFLLILMCLFGMLFPSNINAQNTPNVPNTQNTDPTFGVANSSETLTPQKIVTGVILLITGIIFCFFGRRIYRLTLFLIGFYIGTIIAWIALTNGEPANGYAGPQSTTLILLVSLAVGFLAGLILICCATMAIWLLGALSGYTFALFILSWKSGGLIESKVGVIVFTIVFTLIGLLLACFFEDTLIILGTAFIGAYAMILGIDLFAKTGFAESVVTFMDGNHDVSYITNTKIYIMLVGMVALFIIGALVQYRYHRTKHFGPPVKNNVIPTEKKGWRR